MGRSLKAGVRGDGPPPSGCRKCGIAILPAADVKVRPDAPTWMHECTHGCWCSSWRWSFRIGWRVYRGGRWTPPNPGEVRPVRNQAVLAEFFGKSESPFGPEVVENLAKSFRRRPPRRKPAAK